MKTALILGAGGFIASHAVRKLKLMGYWVRGVDLKYPQYSETQADEFIIGDLRDINIVSKVMLAPLQRSMHDENSFDIVMQYSADMGGALWVFTGEHDADIMHNSALINLNVCEQAVRFGVKKIFYSSSACIYPQEAQDKLNSPALKEEMAYPAHPDSQYGLEKLFSENLYQSYNKNYGLNVRIARFHNIMGIEGTWRDGKEKFPAAICRKIAEAKDGDSITIFGDGEQQRSYLNVNTCLKFVMMLMDSDITEPINIGSDEMISCNDLAKMVIEISGKNLTIEHDLTKPQGVRGRNSDNTLIKEKLGYAPIQNLKAEMTILYNWINNQVQQNNK